MPREPHPAEEVLREANRRRLFRVALAYPAGGFAVMEVTRTLMQIGILPGTAWRVVLGAAVLGFPVAMALTWDYDITSHGVVRTSDDPSAEPEPELPVWRWFAFVLGSLALGFVLRTIR